MTSDSTIDIGLDNRKPWIQAGTLRPELDHNTGRHFDIPLRLVTSRPSFSQTRHLASHNISTIVHGTSKFRYTWRESWCNCARNALHADRGRVISLPRERELLDTFGVRIWQWIYVAFIWHPGFDSMIATISWRQMHKTIIFCLNFSRQLQRNHEQTCTQNRPKHLRVDSKLARLGLRRRRSVLLNTFLTLRILFTIYPFAFSSATVVVF